MGLLNGKPQEETRPGPGRVAAAALARRVQECRKDQAPIDLGKWAARLDKLLAIRGGADVQAVLGWYLPRLGKPGVPSCYSAESFCRNYDRLRQLMLRDPATVQPTSDAYQVWYEVEDLGWPPGGDRELPAAVQLTLDAYYPYRAAIVALRGRLACLTAGRRADLVAGRPADNSREDYYRLRKLYDFTGLVLQRMGGPVSFGVLWWTHVHQGIDGWVSGLAALAFDPQSPRFRRLGLAWAQEAGGGTRLWDDFYREVGDDD